MVDLGERGWGWLGCQATLVFESENRKLKKVLRGNILEQVKASFWHC